MSSQKHIQDELRSLESSLPFNNNHPYVVPEGYFDGLAATILAKVKGKEVSAAGELEEISPLLARISKEIPYSVPSSYFEENAKSIPSILSGEAASPVLDAIGKTLPYSVPRGYFEALPEEILRKTAKPGAKVIPLFARTWMRVATAAAVAGVLFFGGYQLLKSDTENSVITAQQDSADTNRSLAANEPAIVKEIKKASTEDLKEFIEDVQINGVQASGSDSQASDRKEVEELLKDVSITEMESFLAAIPTADDDLLVTD